MPRRPLAAVLALTLLAGLACSGLTAEVTGALTVDDAPFTPTTCRSGVPLGFTGVELADAEGRKLRLEGHADGTATALWFAPGATTGVDLGACATMTTETTGLTVNNVRAVRGSATLGCEDAAPAIVGEIGFDRCATPLGLTQDPPG